MSGNNDWGEQDQLVAAVYDELRERARSYMSRERPDHTLEPTALVNEALVRLAKSKRIGSVSKERLVNLAVQTMREVLVDYARRRKALKRCGCWCRVPLTESTMMSQEPAIDVLVLDEILTRLAAVDPLMVRIVELRLFGGLTIQQTAETLDINVNKVNYEWRIARSWLWHELGHGEVDNA